MRKKKDRKSDLFFTLFINIEHRLKTKIGCIYIIFKLVTISFLYINKNVWLN